MNMPLYDRLLLCLRCLKSEHKTCCIPLPIVWDDVCVRLISKIVAKKTKAMADVVNLLFICTFWGKYNHFDFLNTADHHNNIQSCRTDDK